MPIEIRSPAFNHGGMIPAKHTCEGDDASPPLEWSGIPAQAKSLALIADDPDAPMGDWVHWVVYDLPPSQKGLGEAVAKAEPGPGGSKQGTNGW